MKTVRERDEQACRRGPPLARRLGATWRASRSSIARRVMRRRPLHLHEGSSDDARASHSLHGTLSVVTTSQQRGDRLLGNTLRVALREMRDADREALAAARARVRVRRLRMRVMSTCVRVTRRIASNFALRCCGVELQRAQPAITTRALDLCRQVAPGMNLCADGQCKTKRRVLIAIVVIEQERDRRAGCFHSSASRPLLCGECVIVWVMRAPSLFPVIGVHVLHQILAPGSTLSWTRICDMAASLSPACASAVRPALRVIVPFSQS